MTRRAFFAALVVPVVACVYTMRAPERRPWFTDEDGNMIWDHIRWYGWGTLDDGRHFRTVQDKRRIWWQQIEKGPWEYDAASYAATLGTAYPVSIWLPGKGMVPRKAGTIR